MNTIKTFRPLLNRCLVKRIIPKAKTQGGIILSEKAAEKDARFGEIVSIGPGDKTESGQVIPMNVKVGDYVLLPEYQGTKVNLEDQENEYLIYKDTEILGLVEGLKLH
jgi:chaperonin GroES